MDARLLALLWALMHFTCLGYILYSAASTPANNTT